MYQILLVVCGRHGHYDRALVLVEQFRSMPLIAAERFFSLLEPDFRLQALRH